MACYVVQVSGAAQPVRPVRFWPDHYSQGKNKIPVLQKASNNQKVLI